MALLNKKFLIKLILHPNPKLMPYQTKMSSCFTVRCILLILFSFLTLAGYYEELKIENTEDIAMICKGARIYTL